MTVTPPAGAVGVATVTVTVSDGAESTPTVFTVTVQAVQAVGAPSNLRVISIQGNAVTLGWTAGTGQMAATNHVVEGGVNPGDVAASLPTGSASTVFTLVAPSGAFYVRMKAVAGGVMSTASNEIRIFVNVAAPPSAPAGLLGLVNGSELALAWNNTFGGGAPDTMLLDVTGSRGPTIPLGVSEQFSFAGVPPGTYTLSLRASNASGTSPSSNPVTLTFPGTCSGAPLVPANFVAGRSGNVIGVFWDPAGQRPGANHVPVERERRLRRHPRDDRSDALWRGRCGSYTLSVAATNACGTGPTSAPVTVVIP